MGIAIGVIGSVVSYQLNSQRKFRNDTTIFRTNIVERLGVLEVKIGLFWKLIGDKAAAILHSPHTPTEDSLLEKFISEDISLEELHELRGWLERVESGEEKDSCPGRRLAAAQLLLAIDQRYSL